MKKYDVELFQVGKFDASDFTKDLGAQTVDATKEIDPRDDENVPSSFREGDDYVGCPVCTFQRQYDPESRTEYNRAAQSVKTHMNNIKKNVDEHREALLKIKSMT